MRNPGLNALPILTAMLFVLIGMQMFIIQPGVVQGFVSDLGFTSARAGYVAAAETAGIAVATVACAVLGNSLSWRKMCAWALSILTLSDLLSAWGRSYVDLLILRLIAGVAEGILISLGYAAVGRSSNPNRSFGYLITLVLTYGALGLLAIPAALRHGGVPIIMLALAALAAAGLLAIGAFPEPDESSTAAAQSKRRRLPAREAAMLLAVLAFFLSQGFVWAYLFLIGTQMGIDSQGVANALTVAQIAGIGGALSAATIATRMPQLATLALGTACILVGLLLLSYRLSAVEYAVAAIAFNWAANLLTPFLIALVADLNQRLVQIAVALQMVGLAIGPALAALTVGSGRYSTMLAISAALAALTLFCGGYARVRPMVSA